MKRFGEKLWILRQRKELTLRQLASILEMRAHSQLANIEAGKNMPTAELIIKISDFFDVPLDNLMRDGIELDE